MPRSAPVTDAAFQQAVVLFQRQELPASEAACLAILARRPDHGAAAGLAGLIALTAGRPQEAAERLERAAAALPSSYDIVSNLGTSYIQLERFAAAATLFERALGLRPDYRPARINLATAYRALGDHEAAIASLEPLMAAADGPLLAEMARLHVLAGRIETGIGLYRQALAAAPELLEAQRGLAFALERAGHAAEALAAFRKLAAERPQDGEAQRQLGLLLVKADARTEAVAALRRTLALEPGDMIAREALGQIYRDAVPVWHFGMLNDRARNAAYDAAIRRAVRPGDLVLDIGTGSGLLAMMAARAGAGHVYACETVPLIAEKAREIVQANGLAERITILGLSSRELCVGEHLPRKLDVLVSEIVDAILLGEGILPTLAHAREALVTQDARIIPQSGAIYASAVESAALAESGRVAEAAGFDVSAFNEFSRYGYFVTALAHYPHRALSPATELFRFDLTHPSLRPRSRTLALPITAGGTCHALVSWFELALDDESRVTSAPGTKDSHWMQAVHMWRKPRAVATGDKIALTVSHDAEHIYFMVE